MTQFCSFLWLIFHSTYAPQLFPSHFLSQDQGQKISACRKTHKLIKRLFTRIEHHTLKAVTRTRPGAVVKMWKSSVYSCEPWWWPHKGTRSPPPAHGARPRAPQLWSCDSFHQCVNFCVFTLGFCCNWEEAGRESQHFTWLRGGV